MKKRYDCLDVRALAKDAAEYRRLNDKINLFRDLLRTERDIFTVREYLRSLRTAEKKADKLRKRLYQFY